MSNPSQPEVLRFLPGGKFSGFRSSGLSAYNNVDPYTVVRELVQNALDAAIKRDVIRVVFEIDDIAVALIPGLDEYKDRLACAVASQREAGNLAQAQSVVNAMCSSVGAETARVLWVSDNGLGLNKDSMEQLLGDGHSSKADGTTAGSYGNGHMTAFPASNMRYILYGGVHARDGRTASGHAILASHTHKDKVYGEDGYVAQEIRDNALIDRFSFYSGSEMPLLNNKLDWIEKEHGTGSVVGILGFNRFNRFKSNDETLDVIENVVANHFTPVIFDRGMAIVLRGGNGPDRVVNRDALESILARLKTRQRRIRNSIGPSGRHAWQTLTTLRKAARHTIQTGAGKVRFCFTPLAADAGATNLHLFRNGMWITNNIPKNQASDFSGLQPFNGVVLLEPEDEVESKACGLVSEFEGPRHIDIDLSRKRPGSSTRKQLEDFLAELSNEIRKLIPPLDTQEHDPDFFSVEIAGDGVQQNPRMRTNSVGKGTPERVRSREPRRTEPGGKKRGKRKRSSLRRQGRRIDAQATALWRARGVRIRAKALEDASNAELRLVLANGSDETCDNPNPDQYLEIQDGATVGGKAVRRYVKDHDGIPRAVIIGPVAANGEELDIWLPSRSVPSGDVRVELVRRSPVA